MKQMIPGIRTLALVVLLAGPMTTLSATQPDPRARAKEKPIAVQVNNRNFLDMRIYVVSHGAAWRLGTVSSNTVDQFKLPRFVSSHHDTIRIVAVPIGQRAEASSQDLLANPGDRIVFHVEMDLALSNAMIIAGT